MTPALTRKSALTTSTQTGKAIVAHMLRRQAGVRAGYGPPNRTDLQTAFALVRLEPMTGIEPAFSAWEANSRSEQIFFPAWLRGHIG